MRPLWISLVVLALVAGPAVAQPSASLSQVTDAAQARLGKDQHDRVASATAQAAVAKRYDAELAAVDRLKQQRSSWRRDRQLRDALARSNDTGKDLRVRAAALAAIDARIAEDKRRVLAAIDAELPGLADGPRKRSLTASRAASKPAVAKAHKIVVPDAEIDPLADPEELDQQAQELRASETELERQVAALDDQATRLRKAAALRKAHDRAGDLAIRDDDQVRRTGSSSGGRTDGVHATSSDDDPAVPTETTPPPDMPGGTADTTGFAGEETAYVLSDLLDPATGEALRRAGSTSDPSTKADAARRAHDQVAARLEALRKKRAAIEARAKLLRTK